MTKEQYLNLRDELKELAKLIRQVKPQVKENQRKLSGYESNVMTSPSDYYRIGNKLEGWYKELRPARTSQADLSKLKCEYRAKHIIYSLSRGRTMEQIEPKIRDPHCYWYNYTYNTLLPKYSKQYDFDDTDRLPTNTQKSMGLIDSNGQKRMFTHEEMRMAK